MAALTELIKAIPLSKTSGSTVNFLITLGAVVGMLFLFGFRPGGASTDEPRLAALETKVSTFAAQTERQLAQHGEQLSTLIRLQCLTLDDTQRALTGLCNAP